MILSLILSFVLFVVTLPIKSLILVYELKLNYDKNRGRSSLVSEFVRRDAEKANNKLGKIAVRAIKLALLALKSLLFFIRTLLVVMSIIGFIISVLIAIGLIVIVAGVAGYVVLSNNLDGFSGSISNGIQFSENKTSAPNPTGNYTVASDGSVVNAITILGNWYISDVADYDWYAYSVCPYLSEVDSNGEIIKEGTVRRDCSGFAQAVVRYLAGEHGYDCKASPVPLGSSHDYKNSNSAWAGKLASLGWVYMSSTGMQVSDLQPGDMLIRPGHVEFYMGPNQTFGWGDVQTKLPLSRNVAKYGDYFGIGGKHDYVTVYRYAGGIQTSDVE